MGRNQSPLHCQFYILLLRPASRRSNYRISEPGPPTLSRGDLVTYLGNASSGNRDCLEQSFGSFFGL